MKGWGYEVGHPGGRCEPGALVEDALYGCLISLVFLFEENSHAVN